jgi:hypothetical protein
MVSWLPPHLFPSSIECTGTFILPGFTDFLIAENVRRCDGLSFGAE